MSLPWAPALADVDLFPSTTVSVAPGNGHMNADKTDEVYAAAPSADSTEPAKTSHTASVGVPSDAIVLDGDSELGRRFARTPYEKAEIVVEGAEFAPEEKLPNQTPAVTLDELDPEPTPQGDPSIGDFTGHEGQTWAESHAIPSANTTSIKEIDELNSIPTIDSSLSTPEILVASGEIRTMTFELSNVGNDVRELEIEGVFSSKAPGAQTLTWTLECTTDGGATCPNFTDERSAAFTSDKEVPLFHSVVNMPRDSKISIVARIRQSAPSCSPDSSSETTTKFHWKRLSNDESRWTELELSGQLSCPAPIPSTTPTPSPSASVSTSAPTPTPTATPTKKASPTASPNTRVPATVSPTHQNPGRVIVQPRPRPNADHRTPAPARVVRVYSPQSPNRPSAQNSSRNNGTAANRSQSPQQNSNRAAQRSTNAPIAPINPATVAPSASAASTSADAGVANPPSSYAFNADGRRGGLMSDVEANSAVAVAALLVTAAAGALATFHKGK